MIYTYLFGFTILLNLLLALFILLKNPKNHINISFSLFVFTVVAWMITNFLSNQFTDFKVAFWLNKLIFITSPYISFALLYFSLVFPDTVKRFSKKLLICLLLPVIVSNILTLANLVIKNITFLPNGVTGVVFAPGVAFFGVQFITYILTAVILLIRKYTQSSGHQRIKLQLLLIGVIILTIFGTITNFLIPVIFANFQTSNVGPLLSLFVFGFTAYAIVLHNLFNIKVIATQVMTIILWILLFIKIFVSNSTTEILLNSLVFALAFIFGILLIKSVINEVRQKEQLQELSERLKALDKQKDEFVSMAAHELRAPMTAIKGYLSMIMEGDAGEITEKARDFLADASVTNERLIRLVNNMLNVSRIEEGRMVYLIEKDNLSTVVKSVFAQFTPEAARKGLEFKLDIPREIKDRVEVDSDRLQEVVANLLSNAVKYTEKGSIDVRLTQPDAKSVRFEVEDTGPGISEIEQAKLFQKFARAESSVGKTTGTGLGLYICKLLMKKFDGKIGLISEEGKGSTFWFELPLVKKESKI